MTDWSIGIDGGQGITVSKNQVVDNRNVGIAADGRSVVANVASDNSLGIQVGGTTNATGNATYANGNGFAVF